MTQIGFQLYSLHDVDDPLPTVLERVGETRFDGVEFAGIPEATERDAVESTLDETGLDVAGAHVGLEEVEGDHAALAEVCGSLDCSDVVVPWLDPEEFEDRDSVGAVATRLNDASATLADHGLSLHYHNHSQEFTDLDGRPAIDTLLELTDGVGFELDLGWAGAAGYDPLTVLDRHAERIDIAHLKDYDAETGEPAEVGRGDLDVEAVVDAVRSHDVDWLVYEVEQRPDTYDALDYADDIVASYW
ncbi:sugar phosphate isomerase/epimerase family protein [Halomarina salina]|uniref:Sugar phosphate isomerase/epimerase family protein n=1 Tax=Halomarina salina TaxID=1872699 RepID=A0ABD5RU05_9EURY|nr:sugar phosphate isomerase/epimerase [Halomarina salina]